MNERTHACKHTDSHTHARKHTDSRTHARVHTHKHTHTHQLHIRAMRLKKRFLKREGFSRKI